MFDFAFSHSRSICYSCNRFDSRRIHSPNEREIIAHENRRKINIALDKKKSVEAATVAGAANENEPKNKYECNEKKVSVTT